MEKFTIWCPKPQMFATCGKLMQEKYEFVKDWSDVEKCVESSFDSRSSSE